MAEENLKVVGRFRWNRPPTVYESFVEEEGIPIVRGLGVRDVRDVTLGPWKRTGGQGAYLELNGVGGKSGLYLVEVPPGGALNPEKHMYEEIFLRCGRPRNHGDLDRRNLQKETGLRMAKE